MNKINVKYIIWFTLRLFVYELCVSLFVIGSIVYSYPLLWLLLLTSLLIIIALIFDKFAKSLFCIRGNLNGYNV